MDGKNITDAQMEAEFQERNKNLKQSIHEIVDKIDHAAHSTKEFLEAENDTQSSDLLGSNAYSSTIVGNTNGIGAFEASGNPEFYNNVNSAVSTSSTNRRPSLIREEGLHQNGLDRRLMNSIQDDIAAMHSTDPELFEGVASKFDETFGANALV